MIKESKLIGNRVTARRLRITEGTDKHIKKKDIECINIINKQKKSHSIYKNILNLKKTA